MPVHSCSAALLTGMRRSGRFTTAVYCAGTCRSLYSAARHALAAAVGAISRAVPAPSIRMNCSVHPMLAPSPCALCPAAPPTSPRPPPPAALERMISGFAADSTPAGVVSLTKAARLHVMCARQSTATHCRAAHVMQRIAEIDCALPRMSANVGIVPARLTLALMRTLADGICSANACKLACVCVPLGTAAWGNVVGAWQSSAPCDTRCP